MRRAILHFRSRGCFVSDSEYRGKQSLFSSFRNAWNGVYALAREERNFRVQLTIAIAAITLGGVLQIVIWKWALLLLTIGWVLVAEAVNSSFEHLVDLLHPQQDPLAGKAKDIAAGAVLIASAISVMIGGLVFGLPLYEFLFSG